ncbi:histidine kinase [Paramagnetospirillum marisnigri]|uniref:Histidine kinase n=1 Tax=Paramagnetospirillum marisnigri TaxID=1285242 RepID=A0A178M7N8_9PROT|nr:diguanylate cyclase [Paramagnetospirillum marisnigri]OAN44068.1 histidine kinase [Paramagnetospirillum marisnigri]
MADLGEKITRELTTRYIAVLVVVGFLALLSFLALTQAISDTAGNGETINVTGRQRMLVERVAFAANRLAAMGSGGSGEMESLLADALDQLETRHAQLAQRAVLAAEDNGDAFDTLLRALDREMRDFIAHGRALQNRRPPPGANDPDLVELSAAAAGPLLARLEQVTAHFQAEGEAMAERLKVLQAVSFLLVIGSLVLSAIGVFQPLVRRLTADIQERSRAARQLQESEERLWRILEESPVGVSVSRRKDGRIVFANTRFTDIIGMSKAEFLASSARDHYVDDAQRLGVLRELRRNDGRLDDAEVEFRRKNGNPFWSLLTIRSADFRGEAVNLAWIYDITERKAAEEQILLAAKVLETVSEGVVITDSANRIVFVNPAFSTITEYPRDEVLGRNPKFLHSGRHDAEFYAAMWKQLDRHGRWSGEVWNRRKSGEFFAEWLSISVIHNAAGKVSHHVAVFTDITHRKEDEERIWRQANYDPLTGLPNRSLFLDRLSQAVRQAKRESKGFALMFLDLDGFKAVNDSLGHAAGDVLLQQTALRLSDCMRSSDTLARLAGDEFVVILQGVTGRTEPAIVAGKILSQLGRPYELEGGTAQVRGSIGIALYPDDAEDGPGLVRLADEAMYAVKRGGKNNFRFAGDD